MEVYQKMSVPKFDCNRIVVDGNRLCVVKDTCEGCLIDPEHCALNDLFKDTGLVENWKNWDVPNFRERE